MSKPTEQWKPVAHFPRYQVSNLGRIRKSLPLDRWKILSMSSDAKGYLQASLNAGGYGIGVKVARVVGKAFCPDFSDDKIAFYKDGDKLNCRATNLAWITRSQAWKLAKKK